MIRHHDPGSLQVRFAASTDAAKLLNRTGRFQLLWE
jgi:hypothetical protein